LIVPGETEREVFLSTNICHPSLGNNELSGLTLVCFLAKWLLSLPTRRFTYRIVFVPETIGALVYLSRHLNELKRRVVAGFNVVCLGDERCFSFLPSRDGCTVADRAARHVLAHTDAQFKRYTFLDRGSDERQYCSPGADLPICSIMRSKYGEYPEYHTSLDNLDFITPAGLQGAYDVYTACIGLIERNEVLRTTVVGEPQLGKRGLYPSLSTRDTLATVCTCSGCFRWNITPHAIAASNVPSANGQACTTPFTAGVLGQLTRNRRSMLLALSIPTTRSSETNSVFVSGTP